MPDQLTNVIITKVYEGKSGEGKYGPYTAYNFYVQGEDKKFGWFGGPKKITPVEGMQVAYMEYTTEQDGEYTNYKVSKLVLKEDKSAPTAMANAKEDMDSIPKSQPKTEVSYWVRYMTDLTIALINSGVDLKVTDLDDMARRIGKAGLIMMNESLNSVPIPSQDSVEAPPVQDKEEPVPSDTQNEEDRKLRATLKKYAKANNEEYFKVLGMHGASKAEEVIGFAKEAQESLLKDLGKAIDVDQMPF